VDCAEQGVIALILPPDGPDETFPVPLVEGSGSPDRPTPMLCPLHGQAVIAWQQERWVRDYPKRAFCGFI
jgi:hypothetical protein